MLSYRAPWPLFGGSSVICKTVVSVIGQRHPQLRVRGCRCALRLHWCGRRLAAGCMVDYPAGDDELQVLAWGDTEQLTRPCADCGQYTGSFCDGVPLGQRHRQGPHLVCLAAVRFPDEVWTQKQRTPLCSTCDTMWNMCHFCRGMSWARPPAWRR